MAYDSTSKAKINPHNIDHDFQTGKILALSIGHFVHDVYSSFLAPLLPLLIEKLSLSLTQAGFLSTTMQIPALLNPYIGVMADRISVRYFVILAPALTAVPMSLIGMAPSYGVLLILLFLAGVSVAVFHVPAPVMISDLSATRKGRGMSYFMTGGELARSLGPLVAVAANGLFMIISFMARSAVVVVVGFTADQIGLKATYLISAAIGLIGMPFVLRLPKKQTPN